MPEPLTPETLAEIRVMAAQPLRTQIDMAVVLRQRELLLAEVARLRAHIDDIAAHATPYGDIPAEPGWVGTYLLTAGALHRALGTIGRTAPSCQAEAEVARLTAERDEAAEYRDLLLRARPEVDRALEVALAGHPEADAVSNEGGQAGLVMLLAAERDQARAAADTWRQCHDRHAAEVDRLRAEMATDPSHRTQAIHGHRCQLQEEVGRLTTEAEALRYGYQKASAEADRLQAERDQLRARVGQAWTAMEAMVDQVGRPILRPLRAALLIDGRAPASKGAPDA